MDFAELHPEQMHDVVRDKLLQWKQNLVNMDKTYKRLNGHCPPTRARVKITRCPFGTRVVIRWRAPESEWDCDCEDVNCTKKHAFAFRNSFHYIHSQESLDFFEVTLLQEELFFKNLCMIPPQVDPHPSPSSSTTATAPSSPDTAPLSPPTPPPAPEQ